MLTKEERLEKLVGEVRTTFEEKIQRYFALCEVPDQKLSKDTKRFFNYIDGYTSALDWVLLEMEAILLDIELAPGQNSYLNDSPSLKAES